MAKILEHIRRNAVLPGLIMGKIEVEFTHADFTAAATSEMVSIPGVGTDIYPLVARVRLEEEFSGGTSSACTMRAGHNTFSTGIFPSTNCFTGAGTGLKLDTAGNGARVGGLGNVPNQANPYGFQINATGDDVANLDAGKAILELWYQEFGEAV